MTMFSPAVRIALSASVLALASLNPAAAATSGSVQITGTVAANCSVGIDDMRQTLNLVAGETTREVAKVTENCNSGTGYDISVTSANGGMLKSSGAGTTPINYQAFYDGQGGSIGGGLRVSRGNAQFGRQASLKVSVDPTANAIAGTYSDTITVTIAAK